MALLRRWTIWLIEATGGPEIYPGRDLEEARADLAVTDHEFDIVRTEITTNFYQLGVPEQEADKFMDIIESYRDMVVHDRDYEEDPGLVKRPSTSE